MCFTFILAWILNPQELPVAVNVLLKSVEGKKNLGMTQSGPDSEHPRTNEMPWKHLLSSRHQTKATQP